MNDFLVLGGDKRSVYLIDEIIKNAKTCSYLFIDEKHIQNTLAKKEAGLKEAIDNAKVIILPIVTSKDGVFLNTPLCDEKVPLIDLIKHLTKEKILFKGQIKNNLILSDDEINYIKDENFSLKNAILTSQATICETIKNLEIGINEAHILVTGFGKCSKAICELLKAMRAKVYVSARNITAINKANSLGYSAYNLSYLKHLSKDKDAIINTVPFKIFTYDILTEVKKDCPILDISSSPYGLDKEDADKLDLKYFILPSLPGRFFPKSAGKIIYETVCEILNKRAGDIYDK